MTAINHWIGGRPVTAGNGRATPVYNPATGDAISEAPSADVGVVDAAVRAALDAWPGWRDSSLSRRTEILFRFRQLVADRTDDLAQLIVREHGKVLSDARGEVRRGLDVVEFACGIPQLLKGSFTENASTDIDSWSIRQPLGIVAGITPFNFPVMVPMWMFPIAIACGNAFVLKPSEKDPSPSVLMAELLAEAGLPAGIFSVVHGDRAAVDALIAHPGIRAVSFVGSTPVAKGIYESATRQGKRVQALGGAKNHMIVLPDADLDIAADAAVSAAYGSAGERCMAISVLVAVGDIADDLVQRIGDRIGRVRIGDGMDEGSEMGPLVTREHRDRVAAYVERSREDGATIVADGRKLRLAERPDGFFLGPCLLDHVTTGMAAYRDEIFGPVLSVVRTDSFEAARDLVNASPYANGVALFTRDGSFARRFQNEIEVGMVGINVPIPVPMAYYSFGGWRNSLFGDSNIYGEEGVRFYTRTKIVTSRWPRLRAADGADLAFPTAR
jgi:malonate-semialdehyde dehydrogenase (acetylating) / methylmalonate-semialdehyde dehydrogenase